MSQSPHRPERVSDDEHAGTVATENPGGGRPGERHEVGDAQSSQRNPPHATEKDEVSGRPGESPALPANASGRDRVSADDQDFQVDEESAYDRRPSQDKDRPPSEE